MQTTPYYRKNIKELAENFSPAQEKEILNKMDEIFVNTKELKKLYNQLMEEVYGEGGIKGY